MLTPTVEWCFMLYEFWCCWPALPDYKEPIPWTLALTAMCNTPSDVSSLYYSYYRQATTCIYMFSMNVHTWALETHKQRLSSMSHQRGLNACVDDNAHTLLQSMFNVEQCLVPGLQRAGPDWHYNILSCNYSNKAGGVMWSFVLSVIVPVPSRWSIQGQPISSPMM